MEKECFSMQTKISTLAALSKAKKKEKVFIISVRAQYLKVFGKQIPNNKVNSSYSMETCLLALSRIIWDTRDCISIKMEMSMKVFGITILNRAVVN